MSNREKGVATVPCPNCSTDLKRVTQADGGVAAETCPKCYPSSEKASKPSASATRETGTEITKGIES